MNDATSTYPPSPPTSSTSVPPPSSPTASTGAPSDLPFASGAILVCAVLAAGALRIGMRREKRMNDDS